MEPLGRRRGLSGLDDSPPTLGWMAVKAARGTEGPTKGHRPTQAQRDPPAT